MSKFFTTIMLALLVGSCGLSEEEVVALATREYERKATNFRAERKELCLKAAYEEAEKQADSIIFELRINPLKQPLYRPSVPAKPEFVPTDTTLIKSKHSVKPLNDTSGI